MISLQVCRCAETRPERGREKVNESRGVENTSEDIRHVKVDDVQWNINSKVDNVPVKAKLNGFLASWRGKNEYEVGGESF